MWPIRVDGCPMGGITFMTCLLFGREAPLRGPAPAAGRDGAGPPWARAVTGSPMRPARTGQAWSGLPAEWLDRAYVDRETDRGKFR